MEPGSWYDSFLLKQQAAAKAAILAQAEALEAAGIALESMQFDGCGDEGVTEDAQCYAPAQHPDQEQSQVDWDVSELQKHFETLVTTGYENGCGGVLALLGG